MITELRLYIKSLLGCKMPRSRNLRERGAAAREFYGGGSVEGVDAGVDGGGRALVTQYVNNNKPGAILLPHSCPPLLPSHAASNIVRADHVIPIDRKKLGFPITWAHRRAKLSWIHPQTARYDSWGMRSSPSSTNSSVYTENLSTYT